jgi:seryl-tRNA synthetase
MIDIKDIRERKEEYKKTAKNKNIKVDIDRIVELDDKRRELLKKQDDLNAERNKVSKSIKDLQGEDKQNAIKKGKDLKKEIEDLKPELEKILNEYNKLMLWVPNIPFDSVPVGESDADNLQVDKWGEPRELNGKMKPHYEIGEELDIIDFSQAANYVSGTRFYYLKKEAAMLEQAVMQYAIAKLHKKGYDLFSPPALVKYDAMMGTGYLPAGEEQAYFIEKDNLYLTGTSEVPLVAYFMNKTLEEDELPKKVCGISYCFRREAGTYGKDTKGLYRVHQFIKIEQVIICKNDPAESEKYHKELLINAREILEDLELPYRVVICSTGDMGQGQVFKNDIETYMPSRKAYSETHSCSTFHEFQARRLNIKYKSKNGGKLFAHTLNNTAIASPRILIPILEHYQYEDGSGVEIPKVLIPYMNGIDKIIKK